MRARGVSECGGAKRQLALFGDPLNVTARLCEYCKQVSQHLVVSADLLSRLTIPPDLVVGTGETIALRGRREAIEVCIPNEAEHRGVHRCSRATRSA